MPSDCLSILCTHPWDSWYQPSNMSLSWESRVFIVLEFNWRWQSTVAGWSHRDLLCIISWLPKFLVGLEEQALGWASRSTYWNHTMELACHQKEGEEAGSTLMSAGSWMSTVPIASHDYLLHGCPLTCLSTPRSKEWDSGISVFCGLPQKNKYLLGYVCQQEQRGIQSMSFGPWRCLFPSKSRMGVSAEATSLCGTWAVVQLSSL